MQFELKLAWSDNILHKVFKGRPILTIRILLALLILTANPKVFSLELIHYGPVFDITVKRGEEKLPLFNVPRLKRGDVIQVIPDSSSLARGDWVLQLARVAPSGNLVETYGFDLTNLRTPPELEITADGQIPVILLAPQLRNLFGLYTSFTESSDLLSEVLKSDPQRFFDLQQVDQINQAITALSRGLDDLILNKSTEQAIAATKSLAIKFGVNQIDGTCFKNSAINTQCVAANIVANKDFALPANNELGLVMGQKRAADLTSFLTSNIKVFSEAGDFLTHKFRDQYDFAPTFGRRKGDSAQIELFSLSRFKNGTIKTAYVYVPAWFDGEAPLLQANQKSPTCLLSGKFNLVNKGRLPVRNYWHSWRMTLVDPETRDELANVNGLKFFPERGIFQFNQNPEVAFPSPTANAVTVFLSGMFGFDPVEVEPFKLSLPIDGNLAEKIQGIKQLVSGGISEISVQTLEHSGCIESLVFERDGRKLLEIKSQSSNLYPIDLTGVSAGEATLKVFSIGAEIQKLPIEILPPRARVSSVEHSELDDFILMSGENLERIAEVDLGMAKCEPGEIVESHNVQDQMMLSCIGAIHNNAALPAKALIRHKHGKPDEFQVPLQKKAAVPRLSISRSNKALVVRPSIKSSKWGLFPSESLIADDSELSLILQPVDGYQLLSGNYVLEIRFVDDPVTAQKPISTILMMDMVHQELRTRQPVSFKGIELPSVINPIEFRVRHVTSGRSGKWKALDRSVLMLPAIKEVSCGDSANTLLVHGHHLEFIDAAILKTANEQIKPDESILVPCSDGLCLQVPLTESIGVDKLLVQLHWLNQRTFSVDLGKLPQCTWQ